MAQTVTVHIVRDEDHNKTLCTNEPYKKPPTNPGDKVYLCSVCQLTALRINPKESQND